MCSLRDAAEALDALEVDICAISTDGVATQAKFAESESLGFALLSDPDGSAAQKYDALMEKMPYAKRLTFVVDDKGVLRKIDTGVRVGTHGKDLVEAIKALQGE